MYPHPIKPVSAQGLSFKDRDKARRLCIEALYFYQYDNHTPSYIVKLEWLVGTNRPKPEVFEYYEFLFLGIIATQPQLNEIIKEFATKYQQDFIFRIDRAILQLGIFSLLYEKDIPGIVMIDESIRLAKTYSGVEGYKFINGVLDGVYKKNLSI